MPSKELSMKLEPGRLERFRFSNLTRRVREASFNQLISISTGGIYPNISLGCMVSDMTRYTITMIWYQYVSVWSPNLSVLLPWNILTGPWGGTLKGHRKADKALSRAYNEFTRIDYSDKEAEYRNLGRRPQANSEDCNNQKYRHRASPGSVWNIGRLRDERKGWIRLV